MPTLAAVPRFAPKPPASDDWHRGLPDLAGAGVQLREPRLADAERLARVLGPDDAATLGVGAPSDSDQWVQFVAKARASRGARHAACYLVEPDGAAEVCGLVLLERLTPGSRVTPVSPVFSPSLWPTQLPVHALEIALAFAFETVGVGRVEGRAASARSLEAVRRIGAVEEGVLRGALSLTGGFSDQVIWSVLDTEWAGLHGRTAPPAAHERAARPAAIDAPDYGDEGAPSWTSLLPVLKGSQVTLREVELVDAQVLLNALDPADLETSIEPAPKTRDDLRRYIAWVQLQRFLGRAAGFAIIPRGTRHAAGLIQVRRNDPAGAVAEWGIVLASRYRGTGAAADATRLMAGFAFETLGVHRLEARASGIDPRSIGLMRKMGAVREARLRRSFARGSEVVDDDLWAILKPDWRPAAATSD